MAPRAKKTRSRNSEIRKHSHLSNKPSFVPSSGGDDSLSNSEGNYPQSAMIAESSSSAPTDSCKATEKGGESGHPDLNFFDEDDGSSEIESSGISSGGWSETSGYSSTGSNSDNPDGFRDLEKQLQDSTGDGLDLISSDALKQNEEEDHHNSCGALSLTQLTSREAYASPKTKPAGTVSFGDNFDSDKAMSPIMMGGSEDAADIRPYDARYEGSLSDLMGIVESSNNQFYDSDDSENNNSAPMAGNYITTPTKQTQGPNPMLKPTVLERPPTPPSPQRRSVKGLNVALPDRSPERRKKTFAKAPAGMDSSIKSKKAKLVNRDGKKQNRIKEEVAIVSEFTSEVFGFRTTICSFCLRDVGADIRKCISCNEAYFCVNCAEIGAVGEHQKECAIWKSQGKPSGSKPIVIPNTFTRPVNPSEASKRNNKKCERGKKSRRSNESPVKEQKVLNTAMRVPSDDALNGGDDLDYSPDIIMCEPIDVARAKVQDGDDEKNHFSFDSIPEFSIHNDDLNSQGDESDPNPVETNKSEKRQRKTVKRAKRSLAYLFDSRAPVSPPNSDEKSDAIAKDATPDDESFYSNSEEKADTEDSSALISNLPSQMEEEEDCTDSAFSSESMEENSETSPMSSVSDEEMSKMVINEKLSKSIVDSDHSSDSAVSSEMSIDSLIKIEDDEDEAQTRRGAPSILPAKKISREISYGDEEDLERKQRKADVAEKARRQRRRDHRLLALLIVALICTLVALSAVAGGVVALTFFDEDDSPDSPSPLAQTAVPKPAPVSTPVSPPANDASDGTTTISFGENNMFTQSPTTLVPTEAPTTAPPTLSPKTIAPTVAPTDLPAATAAPTPKEVGGNFGSVVIPFPTP